MKNLIGIGLIIAAIALVVFYVYPAYQKYYGTPPAAPAGADVKVEGEKQ